MSCWKLLRGVLLADAAAAGGLGAAGFGRLFAAVELSRSALKLRELGGSSTALVLALAWEGLASLFRGIIFMKTGSMIVATMIIQYQLGSTSLGMIDLGVAPGDHGGTGGDGGSGEGGGGSGGSGGGGSGGGGGGGDGDGGGAGEGGGGAGGNGGCMGGAQ